MRIMRIQEGDPFQYRAIRYIAVEGGYVREDGRFVRDLPEPPPPPPLRSSSSTANRGEPTHDGTLAGRVAAPVWALVYFLTLGRFGRPIYR